MSRIDEMDPIERDVELAWELFEAQPAHPEVGRLARRVLAQQPGRNGIRMLLAMHLQRAGEVDEARQLFLDVAGQRDAYFVNAARKLRDLEQHEYRWVEARRWADVVLREDAEGWLDHMELGIATAMTGDMERGWQLLDHAVELCARTAADQLPEAFTSRAIYLFQSFAPSERFIPTAEEAMRADPSSEFVGGPLVWAYVHQGRFEEAEELALRMLRLDPTDGLASGAVTMIRETRAVLEREGMTFADFHESGAVNAAWDQMRDQVLGTDLASALEALDEVMPNDLRAALRPPLDADDDRSLLGHQEIAVWHDGQEPGTGALWRADGDFRLMSSDEIAEMDAAIEADPEAYPEWPEESLSDYYAQVMTDDRGGYLIATLQHLALRRAGAEDVVVAASVAAWFWDRVAAFGGRDPRPMAQRDSEPAFDQAAPLDPSAAVLAEIDALNDACLAAPGEIDPQVRLWTAVVALDRWVLINRGAADDPRPFALQAEAGPMICIYSSAERAQSAARVSGLAPDGEPVPFFSLSLPEAVDWVSAFAERGVVGVTLDHPQLGAWCPLPNLAHLAQTRGQS